MALIPAPDVTLAIAQISPVLRDGRFWIALLCGGLALGIAGPFGTISALPLLPRLTYWVFMVLVTGSAGLILCRTISTALGRAGLPQLVTAFLSGLVAGVPMNLLVHGLNALLLRPGDVALGPGALTAALFAITAFISVAVSQIFFAKPEPAATHPPYTAQPHLLHRLPKDRRAPLVALSAIDHYTTVTTTAGSTRLLLRLSDAMAESAPTPGLQIHCSHWVALDLITAARRDGPRAIVVLSDGSARPVSRSFVPALEQTSHLLPRTP